MRQRNSAALLNANDFCWNAKFFMNQAESFCSNAMNSPSNGIAFL